MSKKKKKIVLPKELKRGAFSVLIFLVGIILVFSLGGKAGRGGKVLKRGLNFLFGRTVFLVPLAFFIWPLIFLKKKRLEKFNDLTIALAIFGFIILTSGLLFVLEGKKNGGRLGLGVGFLPLKIFGPLVAQIIFSALIFIDILIFSQIFRELLPEKISLPKISKKQKIKEKKFKRVPRPAKFPKTKREKILIKTEKPEVRPVSLEFKAPPLKLLEKDKGGPSPGDVKEDSKIIKQTLANFGIEVQMGKINVGPTVTQHTLTPAPGIKLSRITTLSNNLALALAAHPIRIEAPIPGKSLVGIEVPNKRRAFVRLRSLISSSQFKESPSLLTFALGRDVSGKICFADLARMPHLMVAGSTGTGKTVCLNGVIISLLYQNSPKTFRLVLIDPKRVEFTNYNGLPYLLSPVIYSPEKTVGILGWLVEEMEKRFDLLSETKAKDITEYNNRFLKEGIGDSIMPYIVLVIDELADLMTGRGREVEAGIVRLAQMARAVGIHLIIATQRPSVEVLTGLIKANITSRISFQVASQIDSRTVLDTGGAEKLLGLGDMLFVSSEVSKPKRIQGAFTAPKEVKKVTGWIRKNQKGIKEDKLSSEVKESIEKRKEEIFFPGSDPLFEKAKKIVIQYQRGSASLLQRKLRIGYARAARLIDLLEKEGIVGPPRGSKARKVFVEREKRE